MNRRALVLGMVTVLIGSAIAVALRAYAEAAFLGAYGGDRLPWLFVAQAGGLAVATLGYDTITRRARIHVVDLALLAVLAVAAAAAPALLAGGVSPVVIVVALAATSQVAVLALWNRMAMSVAGRDARRMLPRAGAAVTLGGAIAGLGAGALIPRVGSAALPYGGAGLVVVLAIVCLAQDRALVAGGAPGAVGAAGGGEALSPVQHRLVAWLVLACVAEALVSTVIDLQFVASLKARYAGDALAVAVALFYGATNAILFVLQSAAVPHLLVTRSLPFTAAIHPVVVIASYVGVVAAPGFFAIAGARTADQVLRLGTSRPAQELALSALPPASRARWKVLLRGALAPAGSAAAALALLAAGGALHAPERLAAIAIAVAVAWWVIARVAARRFQAALAAPLGIGASTRQDDPRRIELETLERWSRAAGTGDERVAALARAALAHVRVDASDLADHLRHDDADVRAALYDQVARAPAAALRGELRAAIAIEDDDRALALAIKALALLGDHAGLVRGASRAGLSRVVDGAVRAAELTLHPGAPTTELAALCARDPSWAAELVRRADGDCAAIVRAAAADPASRAGALAVIARAPRGDALGVLGAALAAGEPDAAAALVELDAVGGRLLAARLDELAADVRAPLARALVAAPAAVELISALIVDRDPEVAHAALRTALAVARGGAALPPAPIAAAHDIALAALVGYLDARDRGAGWTACARHELELATRRCVARLLWTSAVEAASAGRDPAALAATARHLVGGRDADRRRALDVVQELQAGRPQLLAVIERWLGGAAPTEGDAVAAIASIDPWLAELGAGKLGELEATLVALRRPHLFASIAGPALAALALGARRRQVRGELFRAGDPGDEMLVVVAGTLRAYREPAPPRTIEVGDVVGELSVLTSAPRAATVVAPDGADVFAIDRATFAAASRRAPELVLGLSATLAAWLAPQRADVV